jgi:MFS family permease
MSLKLLRYLFGCLLAFLGGHMINFGLVQWTQEVLQAPAWSGALLLVCFGLPVIFGWYGGALCDRLNPLVIARRAHVGLICAALTLAFTAWVPWLRREALGFAMLAALFAGLSWSYAAPARLAYLPTLAHADRLRSAAILFNVLTTAGFGGAPLLIGQIRQHFPWVTVFLAAACMLLASVLITLRLPAAVRQPELAAGNSIRDGWAYIRRTPIVAQLLAASAIAHLLMGPIQVILPRFLDAVLHLDPGPRGVFLSLAAPSLITGGLIALSLKRLAYPGRALMAGVIASATLCGVLSTVTQLPLAVAVFAGACVLAGSAVAFLAASLQDTSADAFRGRVMASYAITTQFFPALSGLLSGLLLAARGPVQALGVYATFVGLIAVLGVLSMPVLRQYRRAAAAA